MRKLRNIILAVAPLAILGLAVTSAQASSTPPPSPSATTPAPTPSATPSPSVTPAAGVSPDYVCAGKNQIIESASPNGPFLLNDTGDGDLVVLRTTGDATSYCAEDIEVVNGLTWAMWCQYGTSLCLTSEGTGPQTYETTGTDSTIQQYADIHVAGDGYELENRHYGLYLYADSVGQSPYLDSSPYIWFFIVQ